MDNRIDALETALKNEMAERDFYLEHATRTRNLFGKRLFEKIAAEEQEHCDKLRQLHEKWKKEEKWPETVPFDVRGTEVKALIQGIKKQTEEMSAGNEDDLKAVRTALAFERKGRDFYAALGAGSADAREKAFFELLSGIENDHFCSLKETEEFLVDPAAWYRKRDKSGWLDGGA